MLWRNAHSGMGESCKLHPSTGLLSKRDAWSTRWDRKCTEVRCRSVLRIFNISWRNGPRKSDQPHRRCSVTFRSNYQMVRETFLAPFVFATWQMPGKSVSRIGYLISPIAFVSTSEGDSFLDGANSCKRLANCCSGAVPPWKRITKAI
jgi:hypothetical protein